MLCPPPPAFPTRRTIALALFVTPSAVLAKPPACAPSPRVLFVCEAGTVNSAIAREVFKARAAKLRLDVRTTSRGLHPENHLTPAVAQKLHMEGVDPAREPARALTMADLATADVVIAFNDAGQAPGLQHARKWSVPSWGADYAVAKAAMDVRVNDLITELLGRQVAGCEAIAQ